MKFERLGDIVSISKGKKHEPAPKKVDRNFRYIQIEDLRNNDNLKYTDEKGVEVNENDLIIAWDGANAGTIGFGLRGMIGSTLARLRIKEEKEYNTDFIGYFLKGKFSYLRSKATGATIPHIDRGTLESLKIPLIDFPLQHEIAKILSKADNLISQRKESINLLDGFLTGTFTEIFREYLNGKNYSVLSSLCSKITDGTHDTPERLTSGVKFITGKHIRPFIIDYDNSDYVTEQVHKEIYRRCNPEFGDILYTNIGVNLGTAAMNTVRYEFSMKNVALLKPDLQKISSRYLEYILNNEKQKQKILSEGEAGGAQKFLSLKQIRDIKLPVPPLELQNKFASIVDTAVALKQYSNESLIELENLFGSLHQRAYKGELEFKSIKQPFIGDPFEGVEIPEGKLPNIADLDKTKWIDVTDKPSEENKPRMLSDLIKESEEDAKEEGKIFFNWSVIADQVLPKMQYEQQGDIYLFINKIFGDDYFTFIHLKEELIRENIVFEFDKVKDAVFKLLRGGVLRQVFADAAFKAQFSDLDPDFQKLKDLKEQIYLQRAIVLDYEIK